MADDKDRDADILKQLYAEDPDVRRLIQKKVKAKNPAAVFPELEVEEQVQAVAKTFGEKLEEANSKIEKTEIETARQRKHAQWAKQGLDPEAIEATIEKYGLTGSKDMPVEQAALRILEAEANTAAGSTENVRESGRMRMDNDWAKVAKANDSAISAHAQDLAHKAIDELNAARRQSQRGFQSTGLQQFKRG